VDGVKSALTPALWPCAALWPCTFCSDPAYETGELLNTALFCPLVTI